MLILSRKKGEAIKIGDDIEIFITDIKGDRVRLGISAPPDKKISRAEMYLTVENNKSAVDKVELLKIFQLTRNMHSRDKEVKEPDNGDV